VRTDRYTVRGSEVNMYCPSCRSEFEAWVKTCPDCDVSLVAELPPDVSHEAPELRNVLETSDPDVLPVATSALRAAGIPFWTPGESSMELLPLGTGGGSVASNLISAGVLVPADRYEEALAILGTVARPVDGERTENDELAEEDDDEDDDDEDDGEGEEEDDDDEED
jgi:hypothetical protein